MSCKQFCKFRINVKSIQQFFVPKTSHGRYQIQSFITKFNQYILDLTIQLNQSYSSIKKKYEEFIKQLDNMKKQLLKISDDLNQQDYKQIKDNLQMIKEWYQYSNNQEEIMKQNQIGTQLLSIKRMIQTLDLDNKQQQQQQIKSIYQDNQITLEQGIELLNQQKWQEANEKINQYLKLLEKQSSFATLFQGISLIEMNQYGKGIIMREQAKKMNNNLYKDLLDYSDLELKKNPKNTFILIVKSYALDDEEKYQLAIEQCEKVIIEEPKHLHALYRKSFTLQNLKENSQAIQCIDIALNYDSKYIVGYNIKGLSLDNLKKYNDAIVCFDKAIQLDPNDASAYMNKGLSLNNLGRFNDAIVCFDKAIQLDPNFALAYNNKGLSLNNLKKYNDAIVCYDKAIQLDLNDASSYYNKGALLSQLKKYQQAIENYKQALLYCKEDKNEFNKLIMELRFKK
ncbi:unnamed protein product [Paramecium pentaurelia]|uniref:Tetratricopeptide repeat protein n=1 Tax=Paramecium pentaurelia TaxID=43138 RepID=A0A8S1YNZ6_9CILI|nr:unnamed protein product [Paramecium pentaurelia]